MRFTRYSSVHICTYLSTLFVSPSSLPRHSHVEDTRNYENDRWPVISSRCSSNVSQIRWRNWTLYMVIEFIIRIQQSDGSECYNWLISSASLGGFLYWGFSPSGGVVVWCISEAAIPLLFGYCLHSCGM